MLGKNILRFLNHHSYYDYENEYIIGLLFVGRTLAQQSNALPACEDISSRQERRRAFNSDNCNSAGKTVSYCIDSGVHVFMNGGDVGISEINLTGENSNPIGEGNDEKLSMYLCDNKSVCKQTEGYIKVSYGTEEQNKKEDYYEIKLNSSKKAEKVTDKCESVEFGAEQNYILDGTLASDSIFKSVANNKDGIVLTRDVSKIYFNNIYTDEEFCQYQDKKIIKRKEQFVSGTILNTLYDCADGVCDISKVPENVENGNYLVDGIIYNRSGAEIEKLTESGIFAFKQNDNDDITYSNY
ncbi:hypothetical protein BCR36DRAFT_375943 [Piromyces finnis]|uniref:Uncharacterized protein n=1 Tax=Piromyces finnis TaxID=1754191 RepID=A0A1Y1U6P8_9FUNG|nr:hypothetical protein BCR36DRAFT_375943 [Piromyces finnis]|eukprot:ORX33713.1 hypothetical protein BCR36DRAFT_375943 [Piromyces finnis]